MSDERHKGWANRETWLVNEWLTKDAELAEDTKRVCNTDGEMLYEAATSLEQHVRDDLVGQAVARGFHADLLNAALDRVHWLAIAAAFRVEASDQ